MTKMEIKLTTQVIEYKLLLDNLKETFETLKNGVKDRPGQVKLCEISIGLIEKFLN